MTEEQDPLRLDSLRRVAQTGRDAIRQIWARRDERASMDPAMRQVLDILEAHKQFRPYWEGAEPEEGVNPFLHVVYHQVVSEQVASGELPEVRAALERMVAAGGDRHDAEHRVMEVLITEMFDMIAHRAPFDRERFRKRLADLA